MNLTTFSPVTTLLFTDAGHLLHDTGYAPTTTRNRGRRKVGGSPEADARAQAQTGTGTGTGTLQFLKESVGVAADSASGRSAGRRPQRKVHSDPCFPTIALQDPVSHRV